MSPLHLVLLQLECIYVDRHNEDIVPNMTHIRLYLSKIRVISLTKKRAKSRGELEHRRSTPWSRAPSEFDIKPHGMRGCTAPKALKFNKSVSSPVPALTGSNKQHSF
jgi:hypothetical protein